VVCVPTHARSDDPTDLTALVGAARMIARHLRPGVLVVLEATTYPGTAEDVVRPLLEASGLRAGTDFFLAVAPVRESAAGARDPRTTPRVVGGSTAACTERAMAFYGRFVDRVVRARGTREAEMAKLIENARRHVAIALANEVAQLSDELGVDVFNAIACADTNPFDVGDAMPAASVGTCVPISPDAVCVQARFPRRSSSLISAAQDINDRMPAYVARRVQDLLNRERRAVNGAHVLLLGVTNAPDVPDDRGSFATDVARALLVLGAHVSYADPYADRWAVAGRAIPRVTVLREAMREAHVSVLLQKHAAYDVALLSEAKLLFDTRGVVPGAERL
jgi:nucleotide sugar dehydrogenase